MLGSRQWFYQIRNGFTKLHKKINPKKLHKKFMGHTLRQNLGPPLLIDYYLIRYKLIINISTRNKVILSNLRDELMMHHLIYRCRWLLKSNTP